MKITRTSRVNENTFVVTTAKGSVFRVQTEEYKGKIFAFAATKSHAPGKVTSYNLDRHGKMMATITEALTAQYA